MGEFIGEVILGAFEAIANWLGWRFWVPLGVAVVLGFIIVPFVPSGDATTGTVVTLAVLGVSGGMLWRGMGGSEKELPPKHD